MVPEARTSRQRGKEEAAWVEGLKEGFSGKLARVRSGEREERLRI